jgi:hypothetical protein
MSKLEADIYLSRSGLSRIGRFLVKIPAPICWLILLILWPIIFVCFFIYHSIFNLLPEVFKESFDEIIMLIAQRQNYRFHKKTNV